MSEPIDLLELDLAEMKELLVGWGQPPYRAEQLDRWIYQGLAGDFGQMTNLPRELRRKLEESARIGSLVPISETESEDRLTRKVLFRADDGQTVETVLMLYADAPNSPELAEGEDERGGFRRRTVCLSTQVGCPVGCPFCATGQAGFVRNLRAGEIVAQVLHYAREMRRADQGGLPVTNIVFMGMGEPLLKFDLTWRAVQALVDPARLGLGARRITLSTAGLVPGIERLTELRSQVNLAVSLHAADDALRDILVPVNRRFPLADLLAACQRYVRETRRRLTFEYAVMEGVNDSVEDARAVARLVKDLLCHVNLIPLNPTAGSPYRRPPDERVRAFERTLRDSGVPTTLRVEKGIEIAAGCGQLRQTQAARERANHRAGAPVALPA